jgi:signal transduction histidine kinase
VTNAVAHGEGSIRVRLTFEAGIVRSEVSDQGAGLEADVRERGIAEVSGRGLWLVGNLARRWGIRDGSGHVRFELETRRRDVHASLPELGEERRPDELGGAGSNA